MKKTKYIVLSIVTLGIYPLLIKQKAKKIANASNADLSVSKESIINVNNFIDDLGGIKNITNCQYTISTLKVTFVDSNKIKDFNILKKRYSIKGVIKSHNTITFLFGDNSKSIAEDINRIIKHNS